MRMAGGGRRLGGGGLGQVSSRCRGRGQPVVRDVTGGGGRNREPPAGRTCARCGRLSNAVANRDCRQRRGRTPECGRSCGRTMPRARGRTWGGGEYGLFGGVDVCRYRRRQFSPVRWWWWWFGGGRANQTERKGFRCGQAFFFSSWIPTGRLLQRLGTPRPGASLVWGSKRDILTCLRTSTPYARGQVSCPVALGQ
jgi:hypothetical protein